MMNADEKLEFIITQGSFKYCELKNNLGQPIINFDVPTSDGLYKAVRDFIDKWGRVEYRVHLRKAQSGKAENATNINLNFSSSTEAQQPTTAQPNMQMNFAQMESQIMLRVEQTMKEKNLVSREEKIKEQEKLLETGSGKLEYVLNNHLIPKILGIEVPAPAPVMQGGHGMPAFQYREPNTIRNTKTKDVTHEVVDEKKPTAKEVKEYEEAVIILHEFIDSTTLLKMARKIQQDPSLVNKLKIML